MFTAASSLVCSFLRRIGRGCDHSTSAYTSSELFHFVGHKHPEDHEANFATLLAILQSQNVMHSTSHPGWGTVGYKIDWERSLLTEELLVPTVTCYADIPFDHLKIHMRKYGCFGLSFSRALLVGTGARPVMYVPYGDGDWGSPFGTSWLKNVEAVYKGFHEQVVSALPANAGSRSRTIGRTPDNHDGAIAAIDSVFAKDFVAYIKPFNAQLDSEHLDNFYMEREWRKYGNLPFKPNHVQRVVVAPGFRQRLVTQHPKFVDRTFEVDAFDNGS